MQHNDLEIEHKFQYKHDIEIKLAKLGAISLNNSADEMSLLISDEYYDNLDNYFLILNDCWLRNRTKQNVTKWELKYPANRFANKEGENFNSYVELDDKIEIARFLINISQKYFKTKINETASFEFIIFKWLDMKPLCLINSMRKSYLLEKIRIDLDETDYNYNCGEIELMIDRNATNEQVQKAYESIEDVASKLGKAIKSN